MLRYMLDTDICIYVMKNRPMGLRQRFDELVSQLAMSAISVGELIYGAENSARRSQNLRMIEEFTGRLDVLPFTAEAAAHYGQIRAALRAQGRPAGVHDMLIGGHARSGGFILVTNNTREFTRMPGLQVENWVQG
jgi:tRNA(fMet)-specific endonuclease VapC